MTMIAMRSLALGLLLVTAAPGLAQDTMPRRDGGPYEERRLGDGPMHGERMLRHGGLGRFSGLSEAGRATMREAMRGEREERREDREAVRVARDRMLAVLEAERLDTAALRRAMDEERERANASRERAQAALLAGFAKLSAADRRAFVADARAMRGRMEGRFRQFRARRGAGSEQPL